MELEVILGNPVRLAREKGIEMARVGTMYAFLKTMQDRRNELRQAEKKKGKL